MYCSGKEAISGKIKFEQFLKIPGVEEPFDFNVQRGFKDRHPLGGLNFLLDSKLYDPFAH